jgi:hypothetical protein
LYVPSDEWEDVLYEWRDVLAAAMAIAAVSVIGGAIVAAISMYL